MPKTIIVTGASKGLGKALVIQFAKLGHTVMAVARNRDLYTEFASYPNVKTVIADLTESATFDKIKVELENQHGIYLVHNAAIVEGLDLDKISTEQLAKSLEAHYELNLKAPILLTHAIRRNLSGGRVLNISSGLAHRALSGLLPYGITKAGLYLGKEYLALEFPDVSLASLSPGTIDTRMQEMLRSSTFSSQALFVGFKEGGKLRSPEEVAKFVSWVLLDTATEDFKKKEEWDISDTSHHSYWATMPDTENKTLLECR